MSSTTQGCVSVTDESRGGLYRPSIAGLIGQNNMIIWGPMADMSSKDV